jgi:hypothetical protein
LPPDHPGAIATRRDLRRINAIMGSAGILARALKSVSNGRPLASVAEIGAGDGEVLLRVARRMANGRSVDAALVDFQDLVPDDAKAEFTALRWQARPIKADIFQWLRATEKTDAILGNLILHHFSDAKLTELFLGIASKADAFIALEPRRGGWPLFCARWLSLIGCCPVTCHDAPVSVQAGFTGRELSALWPKDGNWELVERRAGLFSHLFVARRKVAA